MTDEPINRDPLPSEEPEPYATGPGAGEDATDSMPSAGPGAAGPAPDVEPGVEPGAGATDSIPPAGPGPGLGGPPPPAPAPPVRRLVRDPYSRLGGVSSGIAHYYGFDVSLVRIVTLLLALTTGIGILAYLLAWLIIPRADYWPPAGPVRPVRSLSNRDLGLGLAAIGLVFALAIGGGGAGGFLVPLLLVGGGVWLLLQPQATTSQSHANLAMTAAAPTAPSPAPAAGGWSGGDFPPPPPSAYVAPTAPVPHGAPVPRRSRRRRFGLVALVITALLMLLAIPVLLVGAFFVAVTNDGVTFETETVEFRPSLGQDFPLVIDRQDGEVVIDLTGLDRADLSRLDQPAVIDARLDFGRIEVIVPDDLDVSVQAESQLGNVEVFDQVDDGIRADITRTRTDPDLELRLDVGAGEVVVRRG